MKNRLLTIAMATLCAIGMISCGNPAAPGDFVLSTDNVDEYIVSISEYEGLEVEAELAEPTDADVQEYADYYFAELCAETEGMTDELGNPVPMTDSAIAALGSDAFSTVNEFMVYVRDVVKEFCQYNYENDTAQAVLDNLSLNSQFGRIPEELIRKEYGFIDNQFSGIAEQYGVTVDEYLEFCETTRDELADIYAKQEILMYKIAKDQGIDDSNENVMYDAVIAYILKVTNVK